MSLSEASSPDWLTALLEQAEQQATKPAPLNWLPDFSEQKGGEFVERLPFDRSINEAGTVPAEDATEPNTDNALEDILRKALAQNEDEQAGIEPPSETAPSSEPVPQPDPIAEAFAQGEAEGRQAAMAEQAALREQKLTLRQTFRALDQAAMDVLANDLAETVIALCSQSLADYVPGPEALKSRCLEAAKRIGSGASDATLYLHPDDLRLLDREGLGEWAIVGDPAVEQGGLRLETKDGSVSDRPADWRRAIAAAIRG
ncbi:MAG: FliH/SctL family protein [Pseudomonadota bacterium]